MAKFRSGHIAAMLLLLAASPLVHAADREANERAARKACLSGDYATGVGILADLFIDSKNATYIYNQGRCFEQNNRYDEAIGRFREYLRLAPGLTSTGRAEAEKHIADCQALLDSKSEGNESATEPETTPPARQTEPPQATAPPLALPPTENLGDTGFEPRPGRGLRIAGITCGVLGLAAMGTGIYYYTQARSYSDKVSRQPSPNPADVSAGKDAETMQWVSYVIGGASIATGLVLYLKGSSPTTKRQTTTAFAPLVGPGLAGFSAQGVF